jgi:hypothetical protein
MPLWNFTEAKLLAWMELGSYYNSFIFTWVFTKQRALQLG